MFNNVFLKTVPFVRWWESMWDSQTGHRWQCNATQKRCDLHAG